MFGKKILLALKLHKIVHDISGIIIRTYLKNNLSSHGSVAKRFKMYCSSRFQRDSSFLPFHAPDSRDFAKLNLLFVEP